MPAKKAAKAAPREKVFETTRPAAFAPDPTDPKKSIQVGPQKVEVEGYTGSYKKIGEPKGSETYALKVLTEDEAAEEGHYGNTHHLINQEHSWAGTEKQFREQFEK